jgi:hypothetical protein
MNQLGFDLAQIGAERAADHANREHDDWKELALEAFKAHAQDNLTFTTEDVIKASPSVPVPPDKRAWGAIALAAKRLGLIKFDGYGNSKLAHAHNRPVTRWFSLVCLEPA